MRHVSNRCRVLVAVPLAGQHVSQVGGAAESLESALAVERRVDFLQRGTALTRDVKDQSGIEIAAAVRSINARS